MGLRAFFKLVRHSSRIHSDYVDVLSALTELATQVAENTTSVKRIEKRQERGKDDSVIDAGNGRGLGPSPAEILSKLQPGDQLPPGIIL